MNNIFNKRSVFDLTHEKKLTCDMGQLVPFFCEEVVPGDTFKCKTDMLIRIAPMLAPVMHRINAFTHFFFVPSRLLQYNWEQFITGGSSGTDSTAIPVKVSPASTGYAAGTLWDYFGLPIGVPDLSVVAYPFRAYALIYNEWYRDQNLQPKIGFSTGDGTDTTTNMTLMYRNWEKDYFTSALPWPQRGTAVTLPLGTDAPVTGIGVANNDQGTAATSARFTDGTGTESKTGWLVEGNTAGVGSSSAETLLFVKQDSGQFPDIRADLSDATAASINELRQAFQLQRWMEKNARGGVRYVESVLAHFGVRSSDARLQRPEFLGGGRSPIIVSEVIQTSSTDETSPQGNLAGHGFSAQRSHEFTKSFEEHGYIIGLLSIMPRTAYQQGVPRMWTRESKLDFYWPSFAHLGEQAIKNKEIWAQHASPEGVFGYAPRYEEYRRRESAVCGDFRQTFDYWHMGRIFQNTPELNSNFVTADPTKRINAVTDEHNCWVQIVNNVQAIRPIPKHGTPGLIDHN